MSLESAGDIDLKEPFAKYKLFFDSTLDIVLFVDAGGKILDANSMAVSVYGYSLEELLSMNIRDLRTPGGRASVEQHMEEAFARGVIYETVHRRKDGSEFPVEISYSWVKIDDFRLIISIVRDITGRKEADRGIARLAAIVESSDNAILGMSIDGTITDWNHGAEIVYGYKPEEVRGRSVDILIPEDHAGETSRILSVIKNGGRMEHFDTVRVRKDGKQIFVSMTASPINGSRGELLGVSWIARDVTERKKAEDALLESEEKFRVLAESSAAGIFVYQGERYVMVNQAAESISGYSKEELLQMNLAEFMHPDFKELVVERARVRQRGEPVSSQYEIKIVTKSGGVKWILLTAGRITYRGKPAGVTTMFDITERKRVENALGESEENLRLAIDGSNMGMWSWNLATDEMVWSERCKEIFGLDRDTDISYDVFLRAIHPEDRERIDRAVKNALEQKTDYDVEMRVPWPGGTVHWVAAKGRGFYDTYDIAIRMAGVTQDITERKRVEEALRESEEKFRVLAESSTAAIFVYQGERYVMVNQAAESITGYSKEELLQMNLAEFMHPDFKELVVERARVRQRGEPVPSQYEIKIVTKSGEVKWILITAGRIMYRGKPAGVVTMLDITDRKLAEQGLKDAKAHAELYLDLMGHDITNMNQALMGYLEMMEVMRESGEIDKGLIDNSIEIINRSSRMINDVKKLTQVQAEKVHLTSIDVCEILSVVKAEYSNIPDRSVTINYSPGRGCIVMAGDLLKGVFENLVDNSIRHSKGPLTIDLAADRVTIEGYEYYRITVSDTGPGIPDDLKKKIFVSLEETVEKTARRGFGLYLVRTLIDYYHGRVWVEDRVPGDYRLGAKFVVELPAAL